MATEIVPTQKTVTVTLYEYMKLFRDSRELAALNAAGITCCDNVGVFDYGVILGECTAERVIRAAKFARSVLPSDQVRDALWQAILVKVDQLKADTQYTGASRGPCFYGVDGHTAICILNLSMYDGTTNTYIIEASYNVRRSITLTVDTCHGVNEKFWDQVVDEADANRLKAVVIDDRCYTVTPDSATPGPGDGYGGARFDIEWLDADGAPTGETFITHNLWLRGTVPPTYRYRLAVNARFVDQRD